MTNLLKQIKSAMFEMQSVRNDYWDRSRKELDLLNFRVDNFGKIFAKIAKEMQRRDRYDTTVEQIMAIMTAVQA